MSAMAEPAKKRQVGRNDPCPCGSGRKYKHCCEAKQHSPTPGRRLLLWGVLAVFAIALAMALRTAITGDHGSFGTGGAGRVWSAEHGHWH